MKKSDKIIRKYKEMFETLENYDKTRELPFQRKRITSYNSLLAWLTPRQFIP